MDASVRRKKPRIPDLSHELEEYKRTGDPQKLLDVLRQEAQIERFEAGIEAEEIRDLAVNVRRKAIASQDISNNNAAPHNSFPQQERRSCAEAMSNRPAPTFFAGESRIVSSAPP
jgi:hypothetical protein